MLRSKKKKPGFLESIFEGNNQLIKYDKESGLSFLVSFFSEIRPASRSGRKDAEKNIQHVIAQLYEKPVLLQHLQQALLSQLATTHLTTAITESGIPLAKNFWQELFGRIRHKILPPLQDEDDFLYVVNRVFHRKTDYEWVEGISRESWIQFFEMVGLPFTAQEKGLQKQMLESLKILSFQVAQLGLEREVTGYIPLEVRNLNPFVEQNYLVHQLEELILLNEPLENIQRQSTYINHKLAECIDCLQHIRVQQSVKGASLHQTYILLLLNNRIQRLQILTDALDTDRHFDTARFVDYFRIMVRNENRKNSIREFMSQGVGYLAYQIAEHKGEKGNSYITTTRWEYNKMIFSAMGGGLIICFIAIFKNLLGKLQVAPFWQGFLYSVNYSLGFIAIEQSGSTLATKQPAFTASAVASSMDAKKTAGDPSLLNLAITVAKVSRSQVASFFGNLVIVFPGTYLLAWGYHALFSVKIAEGEAAMQLLRDQHPFQSFSLLYACNTGFFLFLSGIIAGYVQNKIRYGRIGDRLKLHPALQHSMPEKRRNRLALFIERNAGPIAGNIALGFFLGMAGIVGKIFGVPFDIRHITIAAGNSSIGIYGMGLDNIPPSFLVTVMAGVLAIGLLNFLVSFAFAFFVAVKSRGIHLKEYPEFLSILWKYFRKYPGDFILPRKRPAQQEAV
jgi:site-specific recombinase